MRPSTPARRRWLDSRSHCPFPGLAWLVLASFTWATGCGGSGSPTQPLASVPTCNVTTAPLAPGRTEGLLLVDGTCRGYLAHVPASYVATRPVPLVLAMHGYTGTPSSMESFSGLSETADSHGFILVYPAGVRNAWDLSPNGRDVRFLRALVAQIVERASIDRRRIYATGHSMGGAMSARAACEMADLFAAAAPVSGGHPSYQFCSPARPIPILVIHGASDPTVPPAGRPDLGWPPLSVWVPAWAERDRCEATPTVRDDGNVRDTLWSHCAAGAEVRFELVAGLDHGWWWGSDAELWRFFSRHSL